MQQYYNMGWKWCCGIGFSLPYERLLILCILTWFVASYYLSGECTNECQLLLPSPHPSCSLQCMVAGAIFQQNFHISCSIQISFQINSAILQKLSPAHQRIKCRGYEHLNVFCMFGVYADTMTLAWGGGGSSLPHQSPQGNSGRPQLVI